MENKSMENLPIIGVIGGVGPYAGLDFVQKIFANTLAKKDQDHLNCMLVSCSSIIPDRTTYLLQTNDDVENPALGMFESARRLYLAGVRIASVACNTAHANRIFDPFCEMVKKSLPGFRVINMLEIAADHVREFMGIKCLGLLATKGTHKSLVYHEYFTKEDGFILIEPDDKGQEKIHEAIINEDFGIKAHSDNISPQAKNSIKTEIENLAHRGVKAVILGCTELPLATKGQTYPVPLIDPGMLAARQLIALTAPEKILPS